MKVDNKLKKLKSNFTNSILFQDLSEQKSELITGGRYGGVAPENIAEYPDNVSIIVKGWES